MERFFDLGYRREESSRHDNTKHKKHKTQYNDDMYSYSCIYTTAAAHHAIYPNVPLRPSISLTVRLSTTKSPPLYPIFFFSVRSALRGLQNKNPYSPARQSYALQRKKNRRKKNTHKKRTSKPVRKKPTRPLSTRVDEKCKMVKMYTQR